MLAERVKKLLRLGVMGFHHLWCHAIEIARHHRQPWLRPKKVSMTVESLQLSLIYQVPITCAKCRTTNPESGVEYGMVCSGVLFTVMETFFGLNQDWR